ncbi:MAG: HD domain-containing protein [Acidobacteria bacterium]|jgi:HD-GYP domain-containing protein (c-di-GMP phosphodiesterase class II)|nr:HD domain-containing protein [Acidobacteriota bacterium]
MTGNPSTKAVAKSDERILRVSAAMDEFENYAPNQHAAQIAALGDALAQKFNLAAHDRIFLRQAALVHDIGEVLMNREYILSSQMLTANERLDLQRHPVIGEQEAAKLGLSRAAQLLVRWHHEWWNGAGYPDALRREQIPLSARILRVVDSFAALTSKRPFRAAFSESEAARHLTEWAGIEFDPKVVKEFLTLEYSAKSETEFETNQSETEQKEPTSTFE